jgi:hypothetical protein
MNKHFLTILTSVVLVLAVEAHAQTKLQMVISGTCSTLDAQGRIVSQPINNQTLLQQAATAGGLKDILRGMTWATQSK